MLSKIRIFKQPKTNCKIETKGFTLIESLMGILVITVVIVVITPPIVLSAATRVQNRRAEQAMQLAQAETDRIRVIVEQGGAYNATLPPAYSGTITGNRFDTVAAPTTFVAPAVTAVLDTNASRDLAKNDSTKAFGVDIDNDGKADYYVQLFRDNDANGIFPGATSSLADDTLVAFQLGVRVYSKVAAPNVGSLQIQLASLKLTTGAGGQEFSPLAVAYTTVVRSDAKISFDKYKQYLSTPSPSPSASP